MSENELTQAIVAAVSAVVHFDEYVDTGQPADLTAARSALLSPELQQWAKENKVLMPLRRDGKSVFDKELS